jgi:hypothetical protein
MTGDKLAIGAVAALTALSMLKRRGSRADQLTMFQARPYWVWNAQPGKTMPRIGERVRVFFNLQAQYKQTYGPIRNDPSPAGMRSFRTNRDRSIEAARKEKRCVPSNPTDGQLKGMYRSGAIYSVATANNAEVSTIGHARAVAIKNVVFETKPGKIKNIRKTSKKGPCCYGNGTLVAEGAAAKAMLAKLERQHGKPVIVGLNPMRNDSFVVMFPRPPEGQEPTPVYTAEYVLFLDNPKPMIGVPPGLVYAFGINKPEHRDWYITVGLDGPECLKVEGAVKDTRR